MSEITGLYVANEETIGEVEKNIEDLGYGNISSQPIENTSTSLSYSFFGGELDPFLIDTDNIDPNIRSHLQQKLDVPYIRNLFDKPGLPMSEQNKEYREFSNGTDLTLSKSLAQQTGLCSQYAIMAKLATEWQGKEGVLASGFLQHEGRNISHAWNFLPNPKNPDSYMLFDIGTNKRIDNPIFMGTRYGFLIGEKQSDGRFKAPYMLCDHEFHIDNLDAPYVSVPAGMKIEK